MRPSGAKTPLEDKGGRRRRRRKKEEAEK